MSTPKYEAPEFVEAFVEGTTAYVPFEEAVANPDRAASVTACALAEVGAWHREYAAFFERTGNAAALEIVAAIDRLKHQIAEDERLAEGGLTFDEDE